MIFWFVVIRGRNILSFIETVLLAKGRHISLWLVAKTFTYSLCNEYNEWHSDLLWTEDATFDHSQRPYLRPKAGTFPSGQYQQHLPTTPLMSIMNDILICCGQRTQYLIINLNPICDRRLTHFLVASCHNIYPQLPQWVSWMIFWFVVDKGHSIWSFTEMLFVAEEHHICLWPVATIFAHNSIIEDHDWYSDLLWTKATTFYHSERCYLWPNSTTFVCGQMPQHLGRQSRWIINFTLIYIIIVLITQNRINCW